MTRRTSFAFAIAMYAAVTGVTAAQDAVTPEPEAQVTVLNVGVRPYDGCVKQVGKNRFDGYEFDLFSSVWQQAGYDAVKVTPYKTVNELLDAVAAGEVDVGFGGATETAARERKFDSITSLDDAGYSMAVSGKYVVNSWKDRADFYVNGGGKWYYTRYVALIVILGVIFWAAFWLFNSRKRRQELKDVEPNGVQSFTDGAVLAMNMMTTIGTGDVTMRRTIFWRWFTILVLVPVALALFAEFFSEMTAFKTDKRLDSHITAVSDLAGKRVATKAKTASIDVIRDLRAVPVGISEADGGLSSGLQKLREGEVDAVIHDHAELVSKVGELAADDVVIIGPIRSQSYGFFVQEGSPHEERLQRATLELSREGLQDDLKREYFGSGDDS